MTKPIYYDGTKLLSMTDINGGKPEIYMVCSNRSAGKTTYFNRLGVNRFKKTGGKVMVLYRYNKELKDCAEKYFNDIKGLFFPNDTMIGKRRADGLFYELILNDKSFGYAVDLNSADKLKKYSHFFADVEMIIFDEFQSETNDYLPDELLKFQSIHTSVARGKGSMVRYVPVYMMSNSVTLLNPYFDAFGVSFRLNKDTKYLRGDGWILEQAHNENASLAQKQSAFNRAFAGSKYQEYSTQSVYLNDSMTFIEEPIGRSNYLATIKCDGTNFALREYPEAGYVYCDMKPDMTYGYKIAVTTNDHAVNYVMLQRHDTFLRTMRFYFEKGCFRFKDLKCKEAVLKALSYK